MPTKTQVRPQKQNRLRTGACRTGRGKLDQVEVPGEPVADQPVAEVFTLVALDPANHAIDEGGEGQSRDDQRHRDAEQADEDGAEQAGDDPRETDECAAAYPPHELENKCLHGMEGYIARA